MLSRGDQAAMAAQLREDDAFISRVLAFLPENMRQGYGDGDSDDEADGGTAPLTREERQEELRDRLHAKLQLLREKSGSLKAQKNLRKRLNKMEKRKQNQKQARTGGGINSKINAVKTAKKQKMIERKTAKGSMPPHSLQSKPVFNTEGKVVFSKFDFAQGEKPDKSKTKKVSLKTQLVQAREKQAKQKAAGGGGAADKEAWDAAMRKASGERLKDDPKLIAKTIRRERQKKKQSQKKWQERRDSEVQKREEKQGKREANINKRKEQKQKKVIDKLKKKGRILPGF